MRSIANPQVRTEAPLNRDLSAWWLHLPGRQRSYRSQHLSGCPAAPVASLEADAPGTALPSKGRGLAPPGRWGSWSLGGTATTDRLSIPDGYTQLVSGKQVHTISMWIMARSFSNAPVYLSDGSTGVDFFGEFLTTGYIYWSYGGNARTYTSGQCSVGVWNHLCHVKWGSGNDGDLYVNGALASTYTGTLGNATPNTRPLWFGNYGSSGFELNGDIDDVRIYSTRALDAAEVYQLYREGLRGYPTLLRWNKRNFVATSSAQTVAIGLVTETDTALALTSRKTKAIGLTSETDSALAMTARRTRTIGLTTETDSAMAIMSRKALAVGLVAETDTSLAMSPLRSYPVGLTTETDTALALTSSKALALGLTTETDTALGASPARTYPVGLTTETDSSLALSSLKTLALGIASETDSALTMTALVGGQIGLVTETDSALALTSLKTLAVGLTTETDTSLGVTPQRSYPVGLTTETDSALALTSTKALTFGLVTETDSALALSSLKTLAFGLVTETDSALAMTLAGDVIAVGLVTETDTALAVSALKYRSVGLVTETDTALGITVVGLTVAGPYSVATVQVFVPGPEASQVFTAGPAVMEVTE